DLDAVDAADLERDARQRRARLRGEAEAGAARADPVAELEGVVAGAGVQAGGAGDLRLVRREEAVREVLPEVEPAADAAEEGALPVERRRLVARPVHPRRGGVEAGVGGVLGRRRVARVPAPEDEPLRADPVRRVGQETENASWRRTAWTPRAPFTS